MVMRFKGLLARDRHHYGHATAGTGRRDGTDMAEAARDRRSGTWIAEKGGKVVASGERSKDVVESLRERGIRGATARYVERAKGGGS